jgi:thiamine kinase-like enzyme
MDDGTQLRLIDFEYSGNNDPCFELGNTCQELQYNEERIQELCTAYFGEATPTRLARMKLNMIMSDVGWTLWAAIQAKISSIDYDFWGWAVERWGRAVAKMDSPEFPGWLQDVQKPN